MTRLHGAVAFLASILLVASAPVAAQDVEESVYGPDLKGTYNQTTQEIHLSWTTSNVVDAYDVYQNGVLLGSTIKANYTVAINPGQLIDQALNVFYVTTQTGMVDGPPSNPVLVSNGPLDDYEPPNCDLIITYLDTETPPFISAQPDHGCIDAWQRYVGYLIEEAQNLTASKEEQEG